MNSSSQNFRNMYESRPGEICEEWHMHVAYQPLDVGLCRGPRPPGNLEGQSPLSSLHTSGCTRLARAFLERRGLDRASSIGFWSSLLIAWLVADQSENQASLGTQVPGSLCPHSACMLLQGLHSSETVQRLVNLWTMSFSCNFKKTMRGWKGDMDDGNK